jgi:hypothetical protein
LIVIKEAEDKGISQHPWKVPQPFSVEKKSFQTHKLNQRERHSVSVSSLGLVILKHA